MPEVGPEDRVSQGWSSSAPRRSTRVETRGAWLALGFGAAFSLLAVPLPVHGQTLTLAAAGDTYLKSGSPNQNQGQESILRLQSSGTNRALVRFDEAAILSAVGEGSLASARLELYIAANANNWGPDGRTVDVHRLTEPWSELGATWNCGIDTNPSNGGADCAPPWAGGRFAEEPTDTVVHTNGLAGWIAFDVTADVAVVLTGGHHEGWLVKKTEENQTGKVDYASRDAGGGNAPRLVLIVESAEHDEVAPRLVISSPSERILVNEVNPEVKIDYSDGGSGVDVGSVVVRLDGDDLTSTCSMTPTETTCTPGPLSAGTHAIVASVADLAGNLATASFEFGLLVGPGLQSVALPIVADTYLRQGSPNQNQGSEDILRVRSSGHNRALVRVDEQALESLLAGAVLRSATLELKIAANGDNWGAGGRTVDVHRLAMAWGEPTVTWNCPVDSMPANQQPDCPAQWDGGAFEPSPTASELHSNGLRGWVEYDVTADVADFIAGTPNFGWLIKKTAEGASGSVEYSSREATEGEQPTLVMIVEVPGTGDTTPPEIILVVPPEPRIVNLKRPQISATFSDDESGVDAASVRIFLDAVDVTGTAVVSASTLEFTPSEDLTQTGHVVTISLRDLAGNEALASWSVTVDTVAPLVLFVAPDSSLLSETHSIQIGAIFGDLGAGLDVSTFSLLLDGGDITGACTVEATAATCTSPDLDSGHHLLTASVRDLASNQADVQHEFDLTLDLSVPVVEIVSPADGALLNTPSPVVTGTVTDDGLIDSVTVNGQPVEVASGSFAAPLALSEGFNNIVVVAVDSTGKQGIAASGVTLDTVPPALVIELPRDGQIVNQSTARLAGTVTDLQGVASVEANGFAVTLTDGGFETTVDVADGDNPILVRAVDAAGNAQEASLVVVGFSLPDVKITEPQTLSYLAATTVDVSGTVSPPESTVTVNGVPAEVAGGAFTASGVPLVEGGNILSATATEVGGHVSSDSISVVRDLTPPHVQIYVPADGATVYEDAVRVSGLVNDIVPGTVNAGQVAVTVNGVAAQVSNRSFLVPSLPLVFGDNVLVATATDTGGNTAHAQVTIHRGPATTPRVSIVSGDGQTATIGDTLPEPLTLALVDSAGLPVAGRPVLFRLRQTNGSLDGGRRQVAVETGADGTASVHFTLGTRAGVGAQVVEAEAAGFAGPAIFASTALPGEASLIVVDSGGEQFGVAGRPLPRPLIAAVTDSGFNRLEGVPVRFSVVKGAGKLDNGASETVVNTDSDGRAIVQLTLDPEEGISNNVVEARIDGVDPDLLASWTASGMSAGDPSLTSISGVVLDNSNLPVPGATVRIRDTSILTQTNAEGTFRIQPAPVGTLYLIVDGSTVTRPGSWPDLEFVVTTIPGREKTLGMPVYLLPIDLGNGLFVSETQGGTLTLAQIPGFALDIESGSVTFPGGSKSGVVSVTMVHSDRVPMTPNFGQQPRLIVTIQPAGARFDPPARLTLPNVEGLLPGEVTDLYSFDHDLGHFVSIGPGTVSEDGTLIVSNPGVGIVKAGWHCGGNPATAGTAHDCPECNRCSGSACVPDLGQTPMQRSSADCKKEVCDNGRVITVPDPFSSETPPPDPPGNCKKSTCRNDRPDTTDDPSDVPASVEGNCREEICILACGSTSCGAVPGYRPDLSDALAGSGCCADPQNIELPKAYNLETECCSLRGLPVPKGPPVDDVYDCPNPQQGSSDDQGHRQEFQLR